MTTKIKIETFGFKDFEARKKSYVSRAKRLRKEAEQMVVTAGKVEKLAHKLDELRQEAELHVTELTAQGKVRLDGKTANALHARGLTETCGLVEAPTRLYSSNDDLFLENVWWSDEWVLDLVRDMKQLTTTAERKKFYDHIAQYEGDKDAIMCEAGLVALKKHSD